MALTKRQNGVIVTLGMIALGCYIVFRMDVTEAVTKIEKSQYCSTVTAMTTLIKTPQGKEILAEASKNSFYKNLHPSKTYTQANPYSQAVMDRAVHVSMYKCAGL